MMLLTALPGGVLLTAPPDSPGPHLPARPGPIRAPAPGQAIVSPRRPQPQRGRRHNWPFCAARPKRAHHRNGAHSRRSGCANIFQLSRRGLAVLPRDSAKDHETLHTYSLPGIVMRGRNTLLSACMCGRAWPQLAVRRQAGRDRFLARPGPSPGRISLAVARLRSWTVVGQCDAGTRTADHGCRRQSGS